MEERKFNKLMFLPQMGLNDTKHLAENRKKISQPLEVPPYFQICRWLIFSGRWGSSFIYVFRIFQGSCKDAVEEEDKGGGLLTMSFVPNPVPDAFRYVNAHLSSLVSPAECNFCGYRGLTFSMSSELSDRHFFILRWSISSYLSHGIEQARALPDSWLFWFFPFFLLTHKPKSQRQEESGPES